MSLVITATQPRKADRYGISIRDELDQFLLALTPPWPGTQFQPVKEGWIEVDRKEATALIPEITRYSLAYKMRVKLRWSGFSSPDDFLDLFGEPEVRFFTNGWRSDWRNSRSNGWQPGTTSTFDAGLGVVGPDDLAVLWVQDED